VLNLSALTHVRSEKDPYTLMRMLMVNNVSIAETLDLASQNGARKYFSVSTDKARIIFGRLPCSGRLRRQGQGSGSSLQFLGGASPAGRRLRDFRFDP